MWLEQSIRRETGCATYLVGSDEAGTCFCFDPLWDPEPYVAIARRHGAAITHVMDSHSHADHVSGARRLATATGAALLMPALADLCYDAERIGHEDQLRLGELTLETIAMPGHRPEQLCAVITDHSRSETPACLLSADCLLIGDLARPDLAIDGRDGAGVLFDETIVRLRSIPDHVTVYPGHVAGST